MEKLTAFMFRVCRLFSPHAEVESTKQVGQGSLMVTVACHRTWMVLGGRQRGEVLYEWDDMKDEVICQLADRKGPTMAATSTSSLLEFPGGFERKSKSYRGSFLVVSKMYQLAE